MQCCPLQECDERADIFNVTHRRARKKHACEECRGAILPGELHEYISMFFDGAWSAFRQCTLCSEIGDHFSCGRGRVVGTLWDDLEENFFGDMRAGGECMQGLSPAAKQKIIDVRMKWYFEQDEIDDADWEFWPMNRDRQRSVRAPVVEREVEAHWTETPEYYWKREIELDQYREPDPDVAAFWSSIEAAAKDAR